MERVSVIMAAPGINTENAEADEIDFNDDDLVKLLIDIKILLENASTDYELHDALSILGRTKKILCC